MNSAEDKGLPGLDVYLQGERIGRLWLDEHRRFVFQYDAAWIDRPGAVPLSLRLPLQAEPYPDDLARPFFSNLLPEQEIKRVIAQRLRISPNNDFAMLNRIGGECAGAVSLLPSGEMSAVKPGYREINEEELHQIVIDLPRRPLMAGVEGMRLSLAGAQHKLPIYMEADRVFIASGNAPSSHILKPPIRDLEDTVGNEVFCMLLAHRLGLPAPTVTIRQGLDRLSIRRTSARPWAFCRTRNTKTKADPPYRSALPSCRKRASGPPPTAWPYCAGRSSMF
jgi:serine/threonine-protein kinase HipA